MISHVETVDEGISQICSSSSLISRSKAEVLPKDTSV